MKNFVTGEWIYAVERDEDGSACCVSGYLYLATANNAVICTPEIAGCDSIDEMLEYHTAETARNYDTDLAVFPLEYCYAEQEEAHKALEEEK